MSFDVFLHSVHNKGEPRQIINPFTGTPVTTYPVRGLQPHEREGVLGVIAAFRLGDPDGFGCYPIDLPDGGSGELFARELDSADRCEGLMVVFRALTPQLSAVIFGLMSRGNMAALPAMEETRVMVASEEWSDFVLGAEAPPTIAVLSAAELHIALTDGFAGWLRYRGQVTG